MIFVYLLTFLCICLSIWDSPVLSFTKINDKLFTAYLSFEINLNMTSLLLNVPTFYDIRFLVIAALP